MAGNLPQPHRHSIGLSLGLPYSLEGRYRTTRGYNEADLVSWLDIYIHIHHYIIRLLSYYYYYYSYLFLLFFYTVDTHTSLAEMLRSRRNSPRFRPERSRARLEL